jgi:hypothetical protein
MSVSMDQWDKTTLFRSHLHHRYIQPSLSTAGFFGPLTGAIYLPSLVLFEDIFKVSATAINATVSMYMVVFAIAVCPQVDVQLLSLTLSSHCSVP